MEGVSFPSACLVPSIDTQAAAPQVPVLILHLLTEALEGQVSTVPAHSHTCSFVSQGWDKDLKSFSFPSFYPIPHNQFISKYYQPYLQIVSLGHKEIVHCA